MIWELVLSNTGNITLAILTPSDFILNTVQKTFKLNIYNKLVDQYSNELPPTFYLKFWILLGDQSNFSLKCT